MAVVHTRSGAQIVVDGDVVVKTHRAGTDVVALRHRLRIAARLGRQPDGVLVPPVSTETESAAAGSLLWTTRWPRVDVVDPDSAVVPWSESGQLLARLHRVAVQPEDHVLQPGAPARLRRALAAMSASSTAQAATIQRAVSALPEWVWLPAGPGRPRVLVHGDWHLGQLGRIPGERRWRLLDIDDLGVGDPAWDLARPAGFWAAGILPDADWQAFLGGYREAAGPALPPAPADPWPALDAVARVAVVQAAAMGVVTSAEDLQAQEALVAACSRMPS